MSLVNIVLPPQPRQKNIIFTYSIPSSCTDLSLRPGDVWYMFPVSCIYVVCMQKTRWIFFFSNNHYESKNQNISLSILK